MRKTLLALTILITLALGLGACGQKETKTDTPVKETVSEEKRAEDKSAGDKSVADASREEAAKEDKAAEVTYVEGEEVDFSEAVKPALPTDKFLLEGDTVQQGVNLGVAVGKDGESSAFVMSMGNAASGDALSIVMVTGGEKQYAKLSIKAAQTDNTQFYRITKTDDKEAMDELKSSVNSDNVDGMFDDSNVVSCKYLGLVDNAKVFEAVVKGDEDEEYTVEYWIDPQSNKVISMRMAQGEESILYTVRDFDITEYENEYYKADADEISAEDLAGSIFGMLFSFVLGNSAGSIPAN